MNRPWNVAVIGAGMMGRKHAEAWARRPDARVVAVADPDTPRAEALAHDVGARAFARWSDALAVEGTGMVSICTPVCFHREVAEAAAAVGAHMLCEKPMALTLDEADAMIAAAGRHGVRLALSYQYRDLPRFRAIREAIRRGDLGSPLFFRFEDARPVRPKIAMHRRSLNGGPVHDMSGHFFDLVRHITGAEMESVRAHGHIFGRGKPQLAEVTDPGIDAAEILVGFTGGHVASVFIHWGLPEGTPGWTHELVSGPLGVIRLSAEQEGPPIPVRHGPDGTVPLDLPEGVDGPDARIADLVSAAERAAEPEIDGMAGRAALAITLAAVQACGGRDA